MRTRNLLLAVILGALGSCQGCPEECATPFGIDPSCVGPARVELQLITPGDLGEATVGSATFQAPRVRVVYDGADDQPVPSVTVVFAIVSGGGSLTAATTTATLSRRTDALGYATVPWRLGEEPGENRLNIAVQLGETSCDISQIGCPRSIGQAFGSPVEVVARATARVATSVTVVEGDGQTAGAGTETAIAPAVLVADEMGPMPGVPVTFSVVEGGGSVTGAVVTTGSDGVARVGSWILGAVVGANTNVLAADAGPGLRQLITASASAGPARFLVVAAGQGQNATVGAVVAVRPMVRVADQFDNSIAGIDVIFAVGASGGSVDEEASVTVTTSPDGLAAPGRWTLGPTSGTYTLSATVAGTGINGNPALFTATAAAAIGPPVSMEVVEGSNQSVPVGQAVPRVPAVLVRDADGNPVPGVAITFSAGNESGVVSGGDQLTGPDGIAAPASWTLGPAAGLQYFLAEAPPESAIDPPSLAIQVIAVAAAPHTMEIVQGNNQVSIAGLATPLRPAVRILDMFGNPVRGVRLGFTITGGGGSISASGGLVTYTERLSAENGVATINAWVLGSVPGANTIEFAVLSPEGDAMVTRTIVFTAQGVPNPGIRGGRPR